MQEYDIILKYLSDRFPEDFVKLVLYGFQGRVYKVDKELPVAKREVDFLAEVEKEETRFLLHIEFQSSYDPRMPERMHSYMARIVEKYQMPVYPVVVYLNEEDTPKEVMTSYEIFLGGRRILRFNFHVIRIWEIDPGEIIKGELFGLMPLVPLMKHKGEGIIKECITKVETMQDSPLKADIYASMSVLSGLKYSREFIKGLIKEEIMRQSVIYQDIFQEGKIEGMVEGITKGKVEGKVEDILSILSTRFHQIPDGVEEKIKGIRDDIKLKELLTKAVQVKDLDEFIKLL